MKSGTYGVVHMRKGHVLKEFKRVVEMEHDVDPGFPCRDAVSEATAYRALAATGCTPKLLGISRRLALLLQRGTPLPDLGPVSVKQAVKYAVDIVAGVCIAYRNGIRHMDIKPCNVVVVDGCAMLVDFGLATTVAHEAWLFPVFAGSIGTRAPELSLPSFGPRSVVDLFRSELFAAGLTALTLLADVKVPSTLRQALLAKGNEDHLAALCDTFGTPLCWRDELPERRRVELKDLPVLRKGVPPPVLDMLQWVLEMDPMSRPRSVGALVKAYPSVFGHRVPRKGQLTGNPVWPRGKPLDRKRGMLLAWALEELQYHRRAFAIGLVVTLVDTWAKVGKRGTARAVWRAAVGIAVTFYKTNEAPTSASPRVVCRLARRMLLDLPDVLRLARANPVHVARLRIKNHATAFKVLPVAFASFVYNMGTVDDVAPVIAAAMDKCLPKGFVSLPPPMSQMNKTE
jgi:hypothetical protein